MAITGSAAADGTLAAVVAPDPVSPLDTDLPLGGGSGGVVTIDRRSTIVTVNADEVASKIVFTRERPSASAVGANVRLQAVGVVSGLVGLQVVSTSERSGAVRTLVLLPRVHLLGVDQRARLQHGLRNLWQLGRDADGGHSGMTAHRTSVKCDLRI